MRMLSQFRKGVASTFEAFPVRGSGKRSWNGGKGKPTFADIGARIGEDNETLRNLLIDTSHHINALHDLKDTFEKLVEPIGKTLWTREQEKSDNVSLRGTLADIRTSHETLHTEFHGLGKKSAELERDNERLRRDLALVQQ